MHCYLLSQLIEIIKEISFKNSMSDPNEKPTETVGGKSKLKINVPFDLDAIFTLSYDVSGLKGVLEFILENLGDLQENCKANSANIAA